MDNVTSDYSKMDSEECKDMARQLVEESMVLLKNDNSILPLKEGTKIYVTGPAANNTGIDCGGWTLQWTGGVDGSTKFVKTGTTILEGLQKLAEEYNLTIITDPEQAQEADVTVLCVGELPYAEWEGDTEDLSITGELGCPDNEEAIREAKTLGKPTITLMVAGRNVIYDQYEADWDSIVMCYLPGSEADGVANVLLGKSVFKGKLAMPYYSNVKDIGTENYKYNIGYGLEY